MPLIRCSEQKRQSLEEFYSEWASESNEISANIGKSMLKIIDLMNKTFLKTKIYGLTSHANLLLLAEDNSSTDRYVSIIANELEYNIEYKISKDNQSLEIEKIKGKTNSFEELKKFIIIAMTKSQGWDTNDELDKLYKQIKQD